VSIENVISTKQNVKKAVPHPSILEPSIFSKQEK